MTRKVMVLEVNQLQAAELESLLRKRLQESLGSEINDGVLLMLADVIKWREGNKLKITNMAGETVALVDVEDS